MDYDGIQLCGHTDQQNLGGNMLKWPQNNPTWSIQSSLPGFAQDSFIAAVVEAFSRWSRVCGLAPRFTEDAQRANLLVGLQTIGPGGVLADCELPTQSSMTQRCRMRIDTAESWCISDNAPSNRIDLVRVLCHELGHFAGMDHIGGGNLMAPTYSTTINRPMAGDIVEMRARYGDPAPVATQPTPAGTPAGYRELTDFLYSGGRFFVKAQ